MRLDTTCPNVCVYPLSELTTLVVREEGAWEIGTVRFSIPKPKVGCAFRTVVICLAASEIGSFQIASCVAEQQTGKRSVDCNQVGSEGSLAQGQQPLNPAQQACVAKNTCSLDCCRPLVPN